MSEDITLNTHTVLEIIKNHSLMHCFVSNRTVFSLVLASSFKQKDSNFGIVTIWSLEPTQIRTKDFDVQS